MSAANLDAAYAAHLSLFSVKMIDNNTRREQERQQEAMERDDARKIWEETMMLEKRRTERDHKPN